MTGEDALSRQPLAKKDLIPNRLVSGLLAEFLHKQ